MANQSADRASQVLQHGAQDAMNQNPVKDLFPEPDNQVGDSPVKILEFLGKYGIKNLAYDGEVGRNPGYIFRGEAEFPYPLRSRLERHLWGDKKTLTGTQLKEAERTITQEFLEGEGKRLADIIDQPGQRSSDRTWDDIWWWLSLMQHYERQTRLIDFSRDIRIALYFAIEQHDTHPKEDLIIYCFPCKDLKSPTDRNNNKCPLWPKPQVASVDMNLAIGCQIDFPWMKLHKDHWFEAGAPKHWEARSQKWGWDRPYYQNPRLEFQKGMFVYPYGYPNSLEKNGDSWFVQSLRASSFNIGVDANDLPAKRIRIGRQHADTLRTHLDEHYQLNETTIYLGCPPRRGKSRHRSLTASDEQKP